MTLFLITIKKVITINLFISIINIKMFIRGYVMDVNNSLTTLYGTEGILTQLGVHPLIAQAVILAIVLLILGQFFIFPLLKSIQKMNSSNTAEISKTDADALVWSNIKETVEFQSKEVENSREENRRLYDLIKLLEDRIKKLEDIEMDFIKLKKRLNEKDQLIAMQYEELKTKDIQILALNDRVKTLELYMVDNT